MPIPVLAPLPFSAKRPIPKAQSAQCCDHMLLPTNPVHTATTQLRCPCPPPAFPVPTPACLLPTLAHLLPNTCPSPARPPPGPLLPNAYPLSTRAPSLPRLSPPYPLAPRVKHPDWLHKRIRERDSKSQQLRLDTLFAEQRERQARQKQQQQREEDEEEEQEEGARKQRLKGAAVADIEDLMGGGKGAGGLVRLPDALRLPVTCGV